MGRYRGGYNATQKGWNEILSRSADYSSASYVQGKGEMEGRLMKERRGDEGKGEGVKAVVYWGTWSTS